MDQAHADAVLEWEPEMLADGVKENDCQHEQVWRGQEAKQSQSDHNQRVGQHGQAQITHKRQD